jgi:hypothetical protein
MWLYADGTNLSLGTRDFLFYFRWMNDAAGELDLSRPPALLSYIPTSANTNDLAVGVSDPGKKRVLTSTRFASRSGTDRKIYMCVFPRAPRAPIDLMSTIAWDL